MAFHYDFHREPRNEYPGAHFQVASSSDWLTELCERARISRPLGRFHFPGSKRYRPTVEDVIDFLVVEGIARARDGWLDVVRLHREEWEGITAPLGDSSGRRDRRGRTSADGIRRTRPRIALRADRSDFRRWSEGSAAFDEKALPS